MERSPISHWFGSGWDRVSVPLGVWGPWSPRLLTLVGADACRRCCDSRLGGVSSLLALGWLLSLSGLSPVGVSRYHTRLSPRYHTPSTLPLSHTRLSPLSLPACQRLDRQKKSRESESLDCQFENCLPSQEGSVVLVFAVRWVVLALAVVGPQQEADEQADHGGDAEPRNQDEADDEKHRLGG